MINLKPIYDQLARGEITKAQAMELIKAAKQPDSDSSAQTSRVFMAQPSWQPMPIQATTENDFQYKNGEFTHKGSNVKHVVVVLNRVELANTLAVQLSKSTLVNLTLSEQQAADSYSDVAVGVFAQVQASLTGARQPVLLQIVADDTQHQLAEGLAAMLKTATIEAPQFHGQIIFCGQDSSVTTVHQYLVDNASNADDVLVRYSNAQREASGWAAISTDRAATNLPYKDNGVYLITGGLGGLGQLFAQDIVSQTTAAQVVLTGRGELTDAKQQSLSALNEGLAAPRVHYQPLDLAHANSVHTAIADVQSRIGAINGVFHAAGASADNFVIRKSADEFSAVLQPKVAGTSYLDAALASTELDFFALFSSVASVLGNVGQVDYAAANGFLDGFAALRNRQVKAGQRHGKTLAFNWPLWKDGGMQIDAAQIAVLKQRYGIEPINTKQGLQAFYQGVTHGDNQVVVLFGDHAKIQEHLLDVWLSEAQQSVTPAPATLASVSSAPVASHLVANDVIGIERVETYLCEQFSAVLKLPANKINPKTSLEKYGIDSLMAMNLTNQLEAAFGSLPKTLFFEYQTIHELSGYFIEHFSAELQRVFGAENSATSALETPQSTSQVAQLPSLESNQKVQVAAPMNSMTLLEQTEAYLCEQFSEALKLPASKINPKAAMEKYGIDSLMAMNLTNTLEGIFGSLPKTLFFEYQSIHELSQYFVESYSDKLQSLFGAASSGETESAQQVVTQAASTSPSTAPRRSRLSAKRGRRSIAPAAPVQAASTPVASTPVNAAPTTPVQTAPSAAAKPAATSSENELIAIVGMSGRYPQAVDIDTYWEKLASGTDCITEVPKERWDWQAFYTEDRTQPDSHFSKWGGFIEGVDEFDPRFFSIPPREAGHIDPQERLFLQHCWMAVEDAGYSREALRFEKEGRLPGQVGVYVGVMYGEYNISLTVASVANRVSYALNLHGPSITLDTMCSSSLTAMHLACQDLKAGLTDLGIAGGVNVSVHPNKYTMLSAGQFISSDGHCQSFGEGGDGYIPGEGVGALVLQRLTDAEREGSHIYGVIRGTALNHGGKTNGYSVPNPVAQSDVIRAALAKANIDPRHISYLEAHGTGTKLGDPIEIAALTKAFHTTNKDTGYCLIGSAKSNVGHCESAAGVAGVTKVLLQMQHKKIVPSLHSSRLNPHIDFEQTPFIVNQTLKDWPQPVVNGRRIPRIAGISSFGAGGANAHVLIEEYAAPHRPARQTANQVLMVLSARTLEKVKEKAKDLAAWMSRNADANLEDVAFTLQVGRTALDSRLTFLASSLQEAQSTLEAIALNASLPSGVQFNKLSKDDDALSSLGSYADIERKVATALTNKALAELAELWVKGVDVDWSGMYTPSSMLRVSLPTYPFAKEQYWVDPVATPANNKSELAVASLHPLLHSNVSDLSQQCFKSTFNAEDKVVADYQVVSAQGTNAVLAPAVYIEMARIAMDIAAASTDGGVLTLSDMQWTQPLAVTQATEVSVALLPASAGSVGIEWFADAVLAQGHAERTVLPMPPAVDIASLRNQMAAARVDASSVYPAMQQGSLHYGETYRVLSDLYRTENSTLAELNLGNLETSIDHQMHVHPSVVEGAWQAASVMLGGEFALPSAIATTRVFFATSKRAFVWARLADKQPSEGRCIDIDVYDAQGNVSVQMHGVLCLPRTGENKVSQAPVTQASTQTLLAPQVTSTPTISAPAARKAAVAAKSSVADISPSKIALAVASSVSVAPEAHSISTETQAKPNINLDAPAALVVDEISRTKAVITLSAVVALNEVTSVEAAQASTTSLSLLDYKNGLYAIEFADDFAFSDSDIATLLSALATIEKADNTKLLVLRGKNRFATSDVAGYNRALAAGLFTALANFTYPVVSAVTGSALGAGFMLAAFSEVIVCAQDAQLAFGSDLLASSEVADFLAVRFGKPQAKQALYFSEPQTAQSLKANGWTMPVMPAAQVAAHINGLCDILLDKSQKSLSLLKTHLARFLTPLATSLTASVASDKVEARVAQADAPSSAKPLATEHIADGVLQVTFAADADAKKSVQAFSTLMKKVAKPAKGKNAYYGVVIRSEHANFLAEADEALFTSFRSAVASAGVPVIAIVNQAIADFTWLATQVCDAQIYTEAASVQWKATDVSAAQSQLASVIAEQTLGAPLTRRIVASGEVVNAESLKANAAVVTLVSADAAQATALAQLANWATCSAAQMHAWKAKQSEQLEQVIANLPAVAEVTDSESVTEATVVALETKVITATAHANGVLEVVMHDREAKNMFSDDYVAGMEELFAHVAATPSYKAVVLTGYDNYFSSGGSRQGLVNIQTGAGKFTDVKIYERPMTCAIPVIAAMQGHGVGAGWSMGMFADFSIFSEESRYISPYMGYGFTPGAGSTFIFPREIGYDLARETMLCAQEVSGKTFKERGINMLVLPRKQVLDNAMQLANNLAKLSRQQLMALKALWTQGIQEPLEATYDHEVYMHEQTFVGDESTLAKIEDRFIGGAADTAAAPTSTNAAPAVPTLSEPAPPAPALAAVAPVATASSSATPVASFADVKADLQAMLAEELYLELYEIEDNAQFVDLGLDSITGVAFIRKINESYSTDIEATKVYSYPTLAKLTHYVRDEALKVAPAIDSVPESTQTASISESASATELPQVAPVAAPAAPAPAASTQHSAATSGSILSEVKSTLRELLAVELQLEVEEIEDESQFVDLGLDSITGVAWIRNINKAYGTELEATKVYSYPTLGKMAKLVVEEAEKAGSIVSTTQSEPVQTPVAPVATQADSVAAPAMQPVVLSGYPFSETALVSLREAGGVRVATRALANTDTAIAIIGMAGKFPKAEDVDQFWDNIANARNCISEIPADRWSLDVYFQPGDPVPKKTNSKWLGCLESYDQFDPLFFTIAPTEAEQMDPQQRVFLETCWNTIENAGYSAQTLSGSRCGVFVGCSTGDYLLLSREQQISSAGFTGGAISILAARISYIMNLQGPCVSIDTACSSSLVAMANACDSLITDGSDLAIAGGVYVSSGPDMHVKTSQSGMLSADGRCYTFDNRANGFVPGEGVGAVLLKRLADAERDNDTVLGVIEGWGVNQDGKTNGITAPNPESQRALMQDVYRRFDINPEEITLIEAHGTGTKLGDPIEIEGLRETFKSYTSKTDYCAIGSVKSNIGHCLTAAGVSGVVKLLQAFRHQQLPPTVNFESLNEHISLDGSPFFVNDTLQPWELPSDVQRRVAAISSFGFSGTNAHLVLSEYVAPVRSGEVQVLTQQNKMLVPLSARTDAQLQQKARDLITFLKENQDLELVDVAFTLQIGREPMGERLGVMASDIDDLCAKLDKYLQADTRSSDILLGSVKKNKASLSFINQDEDVREAVIQKWIGENKLTKILDLWVKGLNIDWMTFYPSYENCKPKRVALPGYPFAKDRYWIESPDIRDEELVEEVVNTGEHPMLQQQSVVLRDVGYVSPFSEDAEQQATQLERPKNIPKRVPLPTYPFPKIRCWVDESAKQTSSNSGSNVNTSALSDSSALESIFNKVLEEGVDIKDAVKLIKDLA